MKTELVELNQSHISQIFAIEHSAHLTPWSEKIIRDSFGSRSFVRGVVNRAQQPDGLIGYYFASFVADEMSLENICVSITSQGKGYARRLMADLIQQGTALNCSEVILEVRASNSPAIALYEAFEFETVATRKDYYSIPNSNEKEDALIMKRVLI